jgi:C-terminal processing protease CtpA/Prc
LDNFLDDYASPEELFFALNAPQDRFSFIVSDYRVLENSFAGISKNNGMEFGLVQLQSTGEVFGYVRYVLPNTSAEQQGLERGVVFNRIDGTVLTADNFQGLLSSDTYTIGLANFDGDNLVEINEEVTLTKAEYTENPVYLRKIIEVDDKKVGYLMYNGFVRNFDPELNQAFGQFQSENITDLVIDLRYNSGGSIETCNDLASMVTGQFNGDLFITQVYNENFEDEERFFNNEISNGASINSLNLSKVYVLTTQSTASASELLISSLLPYIEVVQIGTTTTGKFQGSVTLYDSPTFSRNDVNINHRYAMQPLILKSVNANGFTDYINGIEPDIIVEEDFSNLGELGDPNEPLLSAALEDVSFGRHAPHNQNGLQFTQIGESGMNSPTYQRMYKENVE